MKTVEYPQDKLPALTPERIAELRALVVEPDSSIDYSDILSAQDAQDTVRGRFYKPLKTHTTVRVDADVLAWLKSAGRGYQTRLNAILRRAMLDDLNRMDRR